MNTAAVKYGKNFITIKSTLIIDIDLYIHTVCHYRLVQLLFNLYKSTAELQYLMNRAQIIIVMGKL